MPFRFTNREYANIHFVYGFCNGNSVAAAAEYRMRFPNARHPSPAVFRRVHHLFSENGPARRREQNRNNNVLRRNTTRRVLQLFEETRSMSIRRATRLLNIPRVTIWKTLHRDRQRAFHLHPVQALHPGDSERRLEYSNFIINSLNNNAHFLRQILWTDEAHFTRRGVINFHNLHLWAHENPHGIRPRNFQEEFSVNVWIGIYNNRIFGPYVLPNRLDAVTFLQFLETNHHNMWEDIPLVERRNAWMQLDGCPAHYGRQVRQWLNTVYGERWIGRGGPVAWPARSPDLNPLDFFLWGFLKQKVYATPVHTREDLINRIGVACNEITDDMLIRTQTSLRNRFHLCIDQNGHHFEHLLH